jgi:hypothetical protein
MNDRSLRLERRAVLRGIGVASIFCPAALTACANSTPPRQVKRSPSHITAKERKDGGNGCWNLCDSEGRYR